MSSQLRELIDGQAFATTRSFDRLARFHVPFDRLAEGAEVERALTRVLERGTGGAAVIGRSGAGKSSVLASLLSPPPEFGRGYLPIQLAIGGVADRVQLSDARQLAARALGDIASNYLAGSDAMVLRQRGAAVVRVEGATETFRAQLGDRFALMSKEIRQAAESFEITRTEDEVLAVLARAINTLVARTERTAVLLLNDSDGLLNLPSVPTQDRPALANEFFATGLSPVMQRIAVPTLIAAQPGYEELDAFKRLRATHLDAVVRLPAPARFTEHGLRLLIDKALGASGSARPIDDVFQREALRTLVAVRYTLRSVRDLMSVCRIALLEAEAQGRDAITEPDVAYGATQLADA